MVFNNPLNLVADGERMEFASMRDFYLKVLGILYHEFPRGYIDYKVFLYDYTMLRGSPLGECCRFVERGWEESKDFCINVHWTYGVQTRDRLTDLIRKMSRSIGCFFSLTDFDAAWREFYQTIDKE